MELVVVVGGLPMHLAVTLTAAVDFHAQASGAVTHSVSVSLHNMFRYLLDYTAQADLQQYLQQKILTAKLTGLGKVGINKCMRSAH
jgi:hypothetical protein